MNNPYLKPALECELEGKEIDLVGNVYFKNKKGELHRLDGPSVVTDSLAIWHKNGDRFRVDGPYFIDFERCFCFFGKESGWGSFQEDEFSSKRDFLNFIKSFENKGI